MMISRGGGHDFFLLGFRGGYQNFLPMGKKV